MTTPTSIHPIQLLLADDDLDDRYLFNRELKALPFHTQLTTVEDGEQLMNYLVENTKNLPDLLFLDNNMPCKNGAECLQEIKKHPILKVLPVIMYSTYVHDELADVFYADKAHYFIKKTDQKDLRKLLNHVLRLFVAGKFAVPTRENFVLTAKEIAL